jgi:parallel beta-helix repeat protein
MKTKKRIFSVFLTLSILLMLLPVTVFADETIWYVKETEAGDGDGTSWANASSNLKGIIADAGENDQVWVAARTYSPGNGQSDTFTLKKGVKVYGGFAGGETSLEARNWATNVTILSGGNTNYHVVTGAANATSDDTRLDGFTIKLGKANGSGDNRLGGGMYNNNSSPTVANCIFTENDAVYFGGGMYNIDSSPTVVNCTFSYNTADDGGGMYNSATYGNPEVTPTVENCTFIDNTSDSFGGGMYNRFSNSSVANCLFTENDSDCGGGMCNYYSDPTVENCSFSNNTATAYGGGIYNQSNSTATLINCTFSGNTADYGGGVFNYDDSDSTFKNCTFSGNTANIDGGGMKNEFSNSTVVNCTFSGNTARYGGGMCNVSSSPTVANTILWGNTAPDGQGPDIYQDGATLNLKKCVVDWGNYNSVNNPTLPEPDVIQTDPKLIPLNKSGNPEPVPANVWIYGLEHDSSAINEGLGVGETVNGVAIPNQDQRGTTRPQGAGVDIGAFEAVLYTVTYDNNGGNGSMTAGTAIGGVPFELPACTFTAPAGKLFMTWAIGSAGSATTADAGTGYTFTGDTTVYAVYRDSVSRLYAQWTKGTATSADFTSDADINDFLYVMVDDNVVDPNGYDLNPGSTKVAFKAGFLETLSLGRHPVNIVSRTGITYGILEIKSPPAPPKTGVPRTGDGMGIYTLPALMLISIVSIILLIRRRRALQKSD